MKVTYYILIIAVILALFDRDRKRLSAGILIACVCAFYEQILLPIGILYLLALTALSALYYKFAFKAATRMLILTLTFIVLFAVTVHETPGFDNQLLINNAWLANARVPYSIWLNFDKIVPALIIYCMSPLILKEKTPDSSAWRQTFFILMLCIGSILLTAILSGYVKLDPKIPAILPIWMINNFLFVAYSEEVIYRGFLQNNLKLYLPQSQQFTFVAIFIATIFFGISHYRSGVIMVCLAAICGIFYGYTYQRTNRILCAMVVHFLLNLTHILLFSYPS